MTDPLRPIISLVESIARTASGSSQSATGANGPSTPASAARTEVTASLFGESLVDRLRFRIAGSSTADAKQLRKIFVEAVLLKEFGGDVGMDAAFADLVERVATVISQDERAGAALDKKLAELRKS